MAHRERAQEVETTEERAPASAEGVWAAVVADNVEGTRRYLPGARDIDAIDDADDAGHADNDGMTASRAHPLSLDLHLPHLLPSSARLLLLVNGARLGRSGNTLGSDDAIDVVVGTAAGRTATARSASPSRDEARLECTSANSVAVQHEHAAMRMMTALVQSEERRTEPPTAPSASRLAAGSPTGRVGWRVPGSRWRLGIQPCAVFGKPGAYREKCQTQEQRAEEGSSAVGTLVDCTSRALPPPPQPPGPEPVRSPLSAPAPAHRTRTPPHLFSRHFEDRAGLDRVLISPVPPQPPAPRIQSPRPPQADVDDDARASSASSRPCSARHPPRRGAPGSCAAR